MATPNRPAAEVDVSPELVRALLADQHPDLAALEIVEFASGWDNVIYRLGDAFTVRLPRRDMAAVLVAHEQRVLPELAPRLPIRVPTPTPTDSRDRARRCAASAATRPASQGSDPHLDLGPSSCTTCGSCRCSDLVRAGCRALRESPRGRHEGRAVQ
jgi:hypothetical protein